jgi:membrane-associated phospholipid phosphatase
VIGSERGTAGALTGRTFQPKPYVHRAIAAALAAAHLALVAVATPAAAQRADSTRTASREAPHPARIFTGRTLVLLGVATAATVVLVQRADERVARELAGPDVQGNRTYSDIADAASYVNEKSLFAAGLVTYGVGRLSHARTLTDVAWHVSEAVFVASASATVLRGILGRSRPFYTKEQEGEYDATDFHPGKGFAQLRFRAMPSIHAAASFATAAVLTEEVRERAPGATPIVLPVAYGLAVLPGLGRMYADKHWTSDVFAGAVLGALSGYKVVRWHHSRPGNTLDRIFLHISVATDGTGRPAVVYAAPF